MSEAMAEAKAEANAEPKTEKTAKWYVVHNYSG